MTGTGHPQGCYNASMRNRIVVLLLAIPVVCILAVAIYYLPPVHSRLAWRVSGLRTQIQHFLNPPQQVIFVPQSPAGEATVAVIVDSTLDVAVLTLQAPTATLAPSATPSPPGPTVTLPPSPTPTPTATPIPAVVELAGIRHEYQQMNNCGPTTLAMALSYWGWQGNQTDTRRSLRPNFAKIDDKNVSPHEMVNLVVNQYGAGQDGLTLRAMARTGGSVDLLRSLVAAGFPVIVERGLQQHPKDWMGHYILVSGYDDSGQFFITYDSYVGPGAGVRVPYPELDGNWWRHFNSAYVLIYPLEREAEVLAILGPHSDPAANWQYSAQVAANEIAVLSGRDLFFAWYNRGASLAALQDWAGAAEAFDQAFLIYPTIPEDDRPWRMLWYQVEPYMAYFHTGRYEDVITLGNQTLNNVGGPILEESFYWLGRAREAQGDLEKAIYDYRRAVEINPNSTPAKEELQRLGVAAP